MRGWLLNQAMQSDEEEWSEWLEQENNVYDFISCLLGKQLG